MLFFSTAPPVERGPYVSTVSIGDVSAEHPVERGSDVGRSERTCSRCGEVSRETPVLDRTIYYEREVVEDGKTTDREVLDHRDSRAPSRQTYVDDEIAHANKRVDSALRSHDSRESPMPTLPTVPEEDIQDVERGSIERHVSSQHLTRDRAEYKETRREVSPKEHTIIPTIQVPSRASSGRRSCERSHLYERTIQGKGNFTCSIFSLFFQNFTSRFRELDLSLR